MQSPSYKIQAEPKRLCSGRYELISESYGLISEPYEILLGL